MASSQTVAQHTRGPWELRPDPKRGVGIVSVRGIETKPIAYVQFANTDLEDGLANARLIAAAPDLLAAVRFCLDEDNDWKDCRDVLCAAFAKAESRA